MSTPTPPQLEAARAQVSAVLDQVEKRKVDLLRESWVDIEKAVIKVLGGPFKPQQPEHQVIALGLAAAFGARLAAEHGAFWFPNRDTPEGAALGFPEALITLAPLSAVMEALASAKLEKLGEVAKEIRTSLAQAKFGAGAPAMGALRLAPEDYMRLFDPGFVQLVSLDSAKAQQTWSLSPERLSIDLRDALNRATKLPPEVKKQLESQLLGALKRLEGGKPLLQQVSRGPRVCELMGLLFASTAATGSAPEEFWMDMVLPLLFIGAPPAFPPLGDEEVAAAKQGLDPLFLFLDVVPYLHQAPDEEGLMGAFPAKSLSVPDPAFQAVANLRLIKVGPDAVRGPLAQFDPAKTRDAIKRFAEHVRAKTGPVQVQGEAEAKQMLEAALLLLSDFKKVVEAGKDVCVRRLTEAEAASEPALAVVRQALSGPRIILST